jgi:hypothetical protein
MSMLPEAIVDAHRHAAQHRREIEASELCGCFYCASTFAPSEIEDWVDWPEGTPDELENEAGTCALCPHCGVDSVIGSASGYPITPEFLSAMRTHWF